MTFHVGQKVVCVDAEYNNDGWAGEIMPIEGSIYTIRQARLSADDNKSISVLLDEIVNPIGPHGDECGYLAKRFRPAVTRSTETGMAILRGLLDTSPVSEPSHG